MEKALALQHLLLAQVRTLSTVTALEDSVRAGVRDLAKGLETEYFGAEHVFKIRSRVNGTSVEMAIPEAEFQFPQKDGSQANLVMAKDAIELLLRFGGLTVPGNVLQSRGPDIRTVLRDGAWPAGAAFVTFLMFGWGNACAVAVMTFLVYRLLVLQGLGTRLASLLCILPAVFGLMGYYPFRIGFDNHLVALFVLVLLFECEARRFPPRFLFVVGLLALWPGIFLEERRFLFPVALLAAILCHWVLAPWEATRTKSLSLFGGLAVGVGLFPFLLKATASLSPTAGGIDPRIPPAYLHAVVVTMGLVFGVTGWFAGTRRYDLRLFLPWLTIAVDLGTAGTAWRGVAFVPAIPLAVAEIPHFVTTCKAVYRKTRRAL